MVKVEAELLEASTICHTPQHRAIGTFGREITICRDLCAVPPSEGGIWNLHFMRCGHGGAARWWSAVWFSI